MSATPMTDIAAAMSRSDPATDRRLPSQCKTGVDASSPRMAPTVTPARSSPIVVVSTARLALMAGMRGPHVETAIPPSPNAPVMVHRQRVSVPRSVATRASVTARSRHTQKTFRWKVSRPGAAGEQPLEDRKRAPDVHGSGI